MEEDEEEPTIPSYAMDLFRRRAGSHDTAQIWKQIENELYGLPQIQVKSRGIAVCKKMFIDL